MTKRFLARAALIALLAPAPVVSQTAPYRFGQVPGEAPSIDQFATLGRLYSVSVSLDGRHLAALSAPDGARAQIQVWDLADLTKAPVAIGVAPGIDYTSVSFVKNDRLLVTLQQKVDKAGTLAWAYRQAITDLTGSFFRNLSVARNIAERTREGTAIETNNDFTGTGGMNIVSLLPDSPDEILARDGATGDTYRVNIRAKGNNFVYHKVYTGSIKYGQEYWDFEDKQVLGKLFGQYENGKAYIAVDLKNPDTGAWDTHLKYFIKDKENAAIVGFTKDPNIILVSSDVGRKTAVLQHYNIRERKFSEPLFEDPLFDVTSAIGVPDPKEKDSFLGYRYSGPTGADRKVFDPKLAAFVNEIATTLGQKTTTLPWTDIATGKATTIEMPTNFRFGVSSQSADGKVRVIQQTGPANPPVYYLWQEGQPLRVFGESFPGFKTEALGETTLIQYKARDGLMIPAYVTKPKPALWGKGPFPAIVLPHGGPWARDDWGWDASGWTQYFASRGYVVIQPQFRTSIGWGTKLARAGDHQYGLRMSDDNDDAAAWLVEQGLATRGHIAIHGYSYGGFAAFAAAARSKNGVFRCAIAGAGVSDLKRWAFYSGENRFQREGLVETMTGYNPADHVDDIVIPMLIYHGDRDQRVPIFYGEDIYKGLKKLGKPVKWLPLKDMGHQLNLWTPQNIHDALTGIEDYLKKDCGPGGIMGS